MLMHDSTMKQFSLKVKQIQIEIWKELETLASQSLVVLLSCDISTLLSKVFHSHEIQKAQEILTRIDSKKAPQLSTQVAAESARDLSQTNGPLRQLYEVNAQQVKVGQRDCFGDDDSDPELSFTAVQTQNVDPERDQVKAEAMNEVDVIQARKEALKSQPLVTPKNFEYKGYFQLLQFKVQQKFVKMNQQGPCIDLEALQNHSTELQENIELAHDLQEITNIIMQKQMKNQQEKLKPRKRGFSFDSDFEDPHAADFLLCTRPPSSYGKMIEAQQRAFEQEACVVQSKQQQYRNQQFTNRVASRPHPLQTKVDKMFKVQQTNEDSFVQSQS